MERVLYGYVGVKVEITNFTYSLEAKVTSTDCIITNWVETYFGGTTKVESTHKGHPKWKPTLRWDLYSTKAEVFIKKIYPYLQLKKEHARVAFYFMAETDNELKELWYQKLKVLNTRGI